MIRNWKESKLLKMGMKLAHEATGVKSVLATQSIRGSGVDG